MWPRSHNHSRLIIDHLSIILDHNCNFISRIEESSRAGKMIFRDNKSCDCGVNEVTAYKGREGSGTHRAAPPETGDRRISNSSYRRSSRRGTNCVTGIPFSRSPATPSAILPDAIFLRWIISYSIANYRMLSGRRFLTRFDFIGNLRKNREQIRKWSNDSLSTITFHLSYIAILSLLILLYFLQKKIDFIVCRIDIRVRKERKELLLGEISLTTNYFQALYFQQSSSFYHILNIFYKSYIRHIFFSNLHFFTAFFVQSTF